MSNIYSLILLITIFFINISFSKNHEDYIFYTDWQRQLLQKECLKNLIFCAMINPIEDVFRQIHSEEIQVTNKNCNNLCITYNNIYARDMICEGLITPIERYGAYAVTSAQIEFISCSVLISGEIGYDNKEYKTINFGTFLSELKFSSIAFHRYDKSDRLDLIIENSTKKYNYDSSRSLFQSWSEDLKNQMNDILEDVYNEFIIKIREKIKPVLSRPNLYEDTKNRIYEKFSMFNGNNLFNKIKNITYLSFFDISTPYKDSIIIQDKIFFYNLLVSFQYALNYNITYNDGYFILRNVCFEVDENKENDYYNETINEMVKVADFNIINNSNAIWEVIINDFKKKFNENKVQEDAVNSNSLRFFS